MGKRLFLIALALMLGLTTGCVPTSTTPVATPTTPAPATEITSAPSPTPPVETTLARTPTPTPPRINYSLSTSVYPQDGGRVNPSSSTYEAGVSVTLTATPAAGYQFVSWSGVSGANPTTIITMDSNKVVLAIFSIIKSTPPVTTPEAVPPPPSYVSPGQHATVSSIPTLSWRNNGGTSSTFSVILYSYTPQTTQQSPWITDTSWQPSAPLEPGAYAWHVLARNQSGVNSDASISWSKGVSSYGDDWWEVFTYSPTSSNPPSAPLPADIVLANPAIGATDVGLTPVLSWTEYTGAIWYELTVSEYPDFSILDWSHNVYGIVYGVTTNDALKYGTTYYWRVRGVTAPPVVVGSAISTPAGPWIVGVFTTMAAPTPIVITTAAPFSLTSPAIGTKNVSIKPTLTWTAYTGAKWYEVTLSEYPDFSMIAWSHNVYGLLYGVVDPLKYGTTYYWRVRGVTADPYVQGTTMITPSGPWIVGAFTTGSP